MSPSREFSATQLSGNQHPGTEPAAADTADGFRDQRTGYAASSAGLCDWLTKSVTGVFLLSLIAAVLVRYSGLFVSVIDWDESLYALMADHWLSGGLPYDAVWDQHSVGLPALFAAILYVFPKSILALRLSACVAVAITSTSLYFMARMIDRRSIVALVGVILYIGWTARLWGLAANTEIYLNALIAPAIYLVIREMIAPERPRGIAHLCLAALLLGLALQIKHVALAETALFFGLIATRRLGGRNLSTTLAATAACFVLPTLVVVAYFQLHGLASEYFHAVVHANLVYASSRPALSEILTGFPRSFALPLGIAAIGIIIVARRPSPLGIVLSAWAVAAAIDVALPGQFWPHYFLLIAPAAALLSGLVVAHLYRAWRRMPAVAVAVAALVLANPVGVYKDAVKVQALNAEDAPRTIGDRVGEELVPGDSIFVFNYQPVVYFLSDAELPTRHVFPADWSQRFQPVTDVEPLRELEKVFQSHPKFVVFVDPDWQHMGADVLAAFKSRLTAYQQDFDVVDQQLLPDPVPVHVYRRKDMAAGPANPPG